MSSSREPGGDVTRQRQDDDELPEPGEEYGASTFGGFADYMRRKRRKLQNKDAEIRASSADKPQIFRGIIAHVNGYTQPSQSDLNYMIVAHGGVFMPVLNQKTAVTHIIASALTPKKQEEFRKYRVVKPSWVTDSISARRLLPWHQYSLLEAGFGQQTFKIGGQGATALTTASSPLSIKENRYKHQPGHTQLTLGMNIIQPAQYLKVSPKTTVSHSGAVADGDAQVDPAGLNEDEIESDASLSTTKGPSPIPAQLSPASGLDEEPPPAQQRPSLSPPSTPKAQSLARPQFSASGRASFSPDRSTPPKNRTRALNSKDPDFIQQFYQESRLHHLSTWKAQLKAQMQKAANEHSSHYSGSLKKRPLGQRRYILHIDFDSFFAAVTMQKNPHLKDKPIAVAHGTGPGAEIASCNYPARKFGVKNGMWMKGALQLCPGLIVVPYDFPAYEEVSKKFYEVLLAVDGIVQSVSIDEALIDISALIFSSVGSTGVGISEGSIYREQAKADEIAQGLRDEIRTKTGCEVSVGIGGNILQAKVALKKAKPAGQFQLKPGDVMEFFGRLAVTDLPGVAHSMGAKLEELGVKLVRDLRCLTRERLTAALGPKTGERLFMHARGIDKTEVGEETARKSISAEINWGIRFADQTEAEAFIHKLCEELHRRCVEVQSKGSQLTVRIMKRAAGAPIEPIKHMGHGPCDTFNKSIKLAAPTNDPGVLGREACQIFRAWSFDPRDIRGVGVQLTRLASLDSTRGPESPKAQRTLEFSRKPITTSVSAPVTPRKFARHRSLTDDQDEIESPRKGDAPKEVLPECKTSLLDPVMKPLNTTGSQFIMPSVEEEAPKVDPTALHSIPNDILSQLKAQSTKRRMPSVPTPTSPTANARQSSSPIPKQSVAEPEGPLTRSDPSSPKRPVSLPPRSALDLEVLSELPEHVRNEYLQQYSKPQPDTTRASIRTASVQPPRVASALKAKPRKVHPAAWARFNKNITLTQSIFQPPSTEEEERLATALEKPDPEVLSALPKSIREEVSRQTKLKEQEARFTFRRRLNHKPALPAGARYVACPSRPEKPTFTSAGLTEVGDIRERISEWFTDYRSDGPYEEDTEILCSYLRKVVQIERDMAKATTLVNWVAWIVKRSFANDTSDGNGLAKEDHRSEEPAQQSSDREARKTSTAWIKTVKQIKSAVNQAVSERGLAAIEFDV